MRESHHDQRRAAHGDAAPHRRHEDVQREERTRSDRHDDHVVGEGPKEVHTDEEVAAVEEAHQSQDFVEVFREDDDVCGVDVEFGLGVDTDSDAGFLQTRDIV